MKKQEEKTERTVEKKPFEAPKLRRHEDLPIITAGSITLQVP